MALKNTGKVGFDQALPAPARCSMRPGLFAPLTVAVVGGVARVAFEPSKEARKKTGEAVCFVRPTEPFQTRSFRETLCL